MTTEPATIPERDRETHETARAVAEALRTLDAPGWAYEPPDERHDWTHSARLVNVGEHDPRPEALWLTANSYQNPGRVTVHGTYPQDPDGRGTNPRDYFTRDEYDALPNDEASAALSRGPEAIAKDVVRRVLPGYRARLAKVHERHAAKVAYADATVETARAIAEATGTPHDVGRALDPEWRKASDSAEWSTSGLPGRLALRWSVSGTDYTTAEVRNMTTEQAAELARLVRSWS